MKEKEPWPGCPAPHPDTPFFVVWQVGGNTPTVKHYTQGAAETEACRLAAANVGKRFVVLSSVGAYVVQVPSPTFIPMAAR